MSPDKRKADDAFMAALLHDIGKLILATQLPDHFAKVTEQVATSHQPMYMVEESLSGVSHAEVGAYLLGIWGLPYAIVEAVAHHHHPERITAPVFDLVTCVHVADALAHEQDSPKGEPVDRLNHDYLEALGLQGKLEGWRRVAEDIAPEARSSPLAKK